MIEKDVLLINSLVESLNLFSFIRLVFMIDIADYKLSLTRHNNEFGLRYFL